MLISSVYGMSAPSKDTQLARQEKVKQIIEAMGDKYLLSKQVTKTPDPIQKDCHVYTSAY